MEVENLQVKLVQEYSGHRSAVYTMAWMKDVGLVSGGGDGWIVHWELGSDQGKQYATTEDRIFSMHSKEHTLVAGTMLGEFLGFKDGQLIWRIEAHPKGLFAIADLDGFWLTAGGDGMVKCWTADAKLISSIKISHNSIRSLKLIDENTLVAGTSDGTLIILKKEKTKSLALLWSVHQRIAAHEPSVFAVLWLEPEGILLSGGRDALLKIWKSPPHQVDNFSLSQTLKSHLFTLNAIAKNPAGNLIATASRDRSVKIWDRTTFTLLKVLDAVKYSGHRASVNRLLWNEHGLFSCSDDRRILHWQFSWDQDEN